MTQVILTIEFGDDKRAALRMYAHFVGAKEDELANPEKGFMFSGVCIPNMFTLMRPAHIDVKL